jgi:hypothetical protein
MQALHVHTGFDVEEDLASVRLVDLVHRHTTVIND